MSNSIRLLMGRVAIVIWASGVILVLSGCGEQDPFMASFLRSQAEWDACKANAGVESAQSGAGLDATRDRCFDRFMAQMDALRQAEEWAAARGGYGARYDAGGVEPFPVQPVHPSGSISLTPDVSAGYYWVPGLNERVFIPGQPVPPFGSITLEPSTRLGYYWVPGLSEQVFVPGQGGYRPPPPQPWPLPKPSYYP